MAAGHTVAVPAANTREESRMRRAGGGSARIAWLVIVGLLVFMLAFAAGCGSDDDDATTGRGC